MSAICYNFLVKKLYFHHSILFLHNYFFNSYQVSLAAYSFNIYGRA
jgi:hypothetical protein